MKNNKTDEQLFEMGIVRQYTSKLKRNEFYFHAEDICFVVPDSDNAPLVDIIQSLVREAFDNGRVFGQQQKAEEVRNVLGIK